MNHEQATSIIRNEWPKIHGREPTENEITFVQAVAWLETNYGRAGQHGALAANGQFNWANIERARGENEECGPGWAEGQDSHPVCFRVYPSDAEAARALIGNLTTRHWPVIDTIRNTPTAQAVAEAMSTSPSYYGWNPTQAQKNLYARAIQNSIQAMGRTITAPEVAVVATKRGRLAGSLLVTIGSIFIGKTAYDYFTGK